MHLDDPSPNFSSDSRTAPAVVCSISSDRGPHFRGANEGDFVSTRDYRRRLESWGVGAEAPTTAGLWTHEHFDQIVSARDGQDGRRRQSSQRTERQNAQNAISIRSTCWRFARQALTKVVHLMQERRSHRVVGAGFDGGFESWGTRRVASAAGEEFTWREGSSRGGGGGHTTPSSTPRGARLLHRNVHFRCSTTTLLGRCDRQLDGEYCQQESIRQAPPDISVS